MAENYIQQTFLTTQNSSPIVGPIDYGVCRKMLKKSIGDTWYERHPVWHILIQSQIFTFFNHANYLSIIPSHPSTEQFSEGGQNIFVDIHMHV